MLGACAMQETPPPYASMAPVAQAKPITKPAIQTPPAPAAATAAVPAAAERHIRVALLLPLSGNQAALGQSMLDAANLAVFDLAGKSFELLPEDTGDTPEGAARAAQQAVAAGARLILGPLFASSTAAVKPIAKAAGIEVVSFTTDAAQAGDNVFVMGFLPGGQVDRAVRYAAGHGVTNIAALVPLTPYGETALDAFRQSGVSPNPMVVKYPATNSDFAQEAQTLSQNQALNGVLIPEGGDKLKQAARAIAALPQHPRLLGTGLWDDPTLGQEPALVGGWYAGVAPTARADFERKFDTTYHAKPQRLDTLAYDATALAVVLAKQAPAGADPYGRTALTKDSGFTGTDGIFRFRDDGLNERGLAVLQVGANGPTVIDPAPVAFASTKPGM
jgi:ABC-type branched-subunit amino acid transport system substrate-binding protein